MEQVSPTGEQLEPDFRMRSATVLWKIEQSLGTLVKRMSEDGADLPDDQVEAITEGDLTNYDDGHTIDASKVISSTYLDGLVDLAVETSRRGDVTEWLKELRNKMRTLDIPDVRNSIAHPNRDFPRNYWYRVATLATDPVVDKLELEAVKNAFRSALKGKVETPPEEWMTEAQWELSNNLPDSYDFKITGFIGRKKERKKIKERLKNERVNSLAIVAPGGVGKTALALHVLDEISKTPESANWIDEIIYVSAKNEILTEDGIEELDTPTKTISGLKKRIKEEISQRNSEVESFKDVLSENEDSKILLCIDNLETLLRDNQHKFEQLYYKFPEAWKILITSRVSVDVASTLTIDNFNKEEANRLARIYLRKRGREDINQNEVDKIIEESRYNPLAIKLSIDHLISGGSVDQAIQRTEEDVVKFSYQNLIDHLPQTSKEVLECLFKSPGPIGRSEVSELLDRSIDEVAEGFSQLMKTSLCTRISPREDERYREERYEISSSVEDLLMVSPADESVREEVQERRRSMKHSAFQSRQDHFDEDNPLSLDYRSEDLPQHIRAALYESSSTRRKGRAGKSKVHDNLSRLRDIVESGADYPELYREIGLLLQELGAREQAKNKLREAICGENFDPASALRLSILCREDHEYDEAIQLGNTLIEKGWDNPENGESLSRSVLLSYYLPKIWSGDHSKVLKETDDWEERDKLSLTYGSIRVQALRNYAQEVDDKENEVEKLVESIEIAEKLFKEKGYAGYLVAEGFKIIKTIHMIRGSIRLDKEAVIKSTSFFDNHIKEICTFHKSKSLNDEEVIEMIRDMYVFYEEEENEMRSLEWEKFIENSGSIERNGEIKAMVKKIDFLGGRRNYFFAISESENMEIFIHEENLINRDEIEWENINRGDEVAVVPDEKPRGEDAYSVEWARYIG